ncbi:MAG: mevalonate kinase [Candidatus Korarchaeota archaeon]|nr:mevalonate kinase [Candidatus Korarchaeota archaeon]NIU82105.1 mevalonate kinase [Candidatus Thorarchaeota archaeon]NIW12516.1 mevalonate kinase [Candidatus Thorarchaeota archaeon]NIW50735.1 mevalonate kinase [Candidatus Korarchaeota archaeon]
MIEASAPHKVILTGEHAVVYGVPSVATSINLRTRVEVRRTEKTTVIHAPPLSTRWVLSKSPPKEFEFMRRIFQVMQDRYLAGIMPNLDIHIHSDVEPGCGLGTSASTAVALTGGLSKALKLNLDKQTINSIAYEGEKITHGTPSGIDNTITTYGGVLSYSSERSEHIKLMEDPPEFSLLLLDSKKDRSTKKAVAKVRNLYNRRRKLVEGIFKEIQEISETLWAELQNSHDWERIGQLLNKNHALLQQLGVSNSLLDELVEIARTSGALGAKLTGAGLGGYVIALPPRGREKLVKERIAQEIGDRVSLVDSSRDGLELVGQLDH